MATQKCCLNSHFNLSRRGNGCMREYENRVNSKALVLTPSETHFCCARHNPDAKTFTHSPTGHASSPPPIPPPPKQVPLHSLFNQIFFMSCFKNKRTITGRVQAGGGRRARREEQEPKMTETQSGYGPLLVFIDSRPILKLFLYPN